VLTLHIVIHLLDCSAISELGNSDHYGISVTMKWEPHRSQYIIYPAWASLEV